MRIYLVRHGQSQSNADWTVNQRVADHAIELTDAGHEQAKAAGTALAVHLHDSLVSPFSAGAPRTIPKVRLWHSPYMRTRQTAAGLEETCLLPQLNDGIPTEYRIPEKSGSDTLHHSIRKPGDSWFYDKREHMLLAEQQFGLFDGLNDDEREKQFPKEHAYYQKCRAFEGKMWPKMPQGESRFEVCQRVHQSFGTFHRDAARHGIENIVVVGHGTTNRAFVTMWLHKPWEWMHQEPNPLNTSIRLIVDGEDKGYIFDGFKGGQHAGQ